MEAWVAKRKMFRGTTTHENLIKRPEYTHMTAVILPDIISGGLFMSAIPARMNPQLLTGPQKCVVLGPTGLFKIGRAHV